MLPANRARTAIAAVAALFLPAAGAAAQYEQGDGRALDANQQVGTGGINSYVRDINATIRFNNAVVTGNASFGRSFRGEVGYLSPYEFRGALGSNDLFAFRREPVLNRPDLGIRGGDAIRYQFAISTGLAPPPVLGASAGVLERSGAGESGRSLSSAARSTAAFLSEREYSPTLLQYQTMTDGSQFVLSANPLDGIRRVEIPEVEVSGPDSGVMPELPFSGLETTPQEMLSPFESGLDTENKITNRLPPAVATAHQTALDRFETAYVPTLETRSDTVVDTSTGAEEDDEPTPGSPEWVRRLTESRIQLLEMKSTLDDIERDSDNDADGDFDGDTEGDEGDDSSASTSPRRLLDLVDAEEAETLRFLKAVRDASVLVERLDGDDEVVRPMYNQHMRSGQEAITVGRYFDAEDYFLRALAARPGDAMASIGRVHAQLGAGLYLSAALNLRNVISRQPELTGARFDERLLPNFERIEVVIEQLQDMVEKRRPAFDVDAAFLLAYVGYQLQDRQVLETGLFNFRRLSDSTDDAQMALVNLVSGVWTIGPDPAPADSP